MDRIRVETPEEFRMPTVTSLLASISIAIQPLASHWIVSNNHFSVERTLSIVRQKSPNTILTEKTYKLKLKLKIRIELRNGNHFACSVVFRCSDLMGSGCPDVSLPIR